MNLEDLQNEEEIDDPLMILKAVLLQVERECMFIFVCVYQVYDSVGRSDIVTIHSLFLLGNSLCLF